MRSLAKVLFIVSISLPLRAGFAAPDIDAIPDGYTDGRVGAPYGTYFTPVDDGARPFQDQVLYLERKIFGLAHLMNEEPAKQAELATLLEYHIARVEMDIMDAPPGTMTDFERDSLLSSAAHAHRNLRTYSERLFEDMVRFIDKKLPGPNGGQFRANGSQKVLYEPNYRIDTRVSPEEQAKLYAARLDEFTKGGGSMSEIYALDHAAAKDFGAFTRHEYVQLAGGEIMATAGKAGHLLLAQGKPVQTAGQFVLIRGKNGRFASLVITNASGSYKPDLMSTQRLANSLGKMLHIPADRIIVTKGEPFSTQAVKIYMKGAGKDKALIDSEVKRVEQAARNIMAKPGVTPRANAALPAFVPTNCAAELKELAAGIGP